MKIVPNKVFILLVTFLACIAANAAPPNPPPPSSPPPPPGLPLDGGVFVLLLLSIVYGLYKIVLENQKKASHE